MGKEMELFEAASSGDLSKVESLINQGVYIDYKDCNGQTALMRAVCNGRADAVKLLIEKGADPNEEDKDRNFPLIIAAGKGDLGIVEILLACKRTIINHENCLRDTPLMWAASNGHIEVVRTLIKRNANPNLQNKDGWTPLMGAVKNHHMEVVKMLLEYELTDVNLRDNSHYMRYDYDYIPVYGYSALIKASGDGDLEMVRLLLSCKRIDIDEKNFFNDTALMWAAANGHVEVVKELIANGADPNVTNKGNRTALMNAVFNNHLEVVKFLLNCKHIDYSVGKYEGCNFTNILGCARALGNTEMASLIKETSFKRYKEEYLSLQQKSFALCMGIHPRLGEYSPMLGNADTYTLQKIMKPINEEIILQLERKFAKVQDRPGEFRERMHMTLSRQHTSSGSMELVL